MERQKLGNINIENAQIGFRNFTGKIGQYNAAGDRTFAVFLDPKLAKTLEADGWNVRYLEPKDGSEERRPILSVKVNYKNRPPKVAVISGQRPPTILEEDDVHILDWAEIEKVDLVLNPSSWSFGGKQGVKAYVKSMWVTIVEDPFESKYINAPDSLENGRCDDCQNMSGACKDCTYNQ